MKDLAHSILITIIALVFVLPAVVVGQVRESTNFKIERDSINIGGGFSTSDNFGLQDTVGEVGTGFSESDNYTMSAGYQQSLEETYIAISSPADVNMNSINGLTGGVSTSSVAWNVTTNSRSGYALSVRSSTTPALKSGLDFFVDYSGSPSVWGIAPTSAEFGFRPSGADVVPIMLNNWMGFDTADIGIAVSGSSNHPLGTPTTVNLQAESGVDKILTAGNYSATIIVTAIAL